MLMTLTCFKAYDIRGKLGSELNGYLAYRIGLEYAQHLNAKHVVVAATCASPVSHFKKHGLKRENLA